MTTLDTEFIKAEEADRLDQELFGLTITGVSVNDFGEVTISLSGGHGPHIRQVHIEGQGYETSALTLELTRA